MLGSTIVYATPYKPNPVLRWIVRTCLFLVMIASVIYNTAQFYTILERIKHGHPNGTTRRSLDSKGRATR
jgi:hypothetical protein